MPTEAPEMEFWGLFLLGISKTAAREWIEMCITKLPLAGIVVDAITQA
jgi:hypothetical protein